MPRPPPPTNLVEATPISRSSAPAPQTSAAAMRSRGRSPTGRNTGRRSAVALARALGPVPDPPPSLEPTNHGTLDRDGYRVEKVTFQTLPGVRMTANLYLPKSPGRHPAILAVHGHWRGAKQDPVVQARCIGAVKLGFAVLAVDAFGAGERAVGKALGEYHGEMTAATLFPTGQTLAGLQVYENARALAYLATRPEVDAARVGITGASGGGNQSMYAAAMIDGLKAAVPVCSVGNYRTYLGIACCMCEVVPGALTFAEEWGVLGLAAPKPLMVVSATRDAVQFSVSEARKTIAGLEALYSLFGSPQNLRHAIFESGHDYNKAMREAAYGWFARHLAGQGDGSPIVEPAFETEDPEALRCFPGDTRPDDFVTLPKYAAAEGRRLADAKDVLVRPRLLEGRGGTAPRGACDDARGVPGRAAGLPAGRARRRRPRRQVRVGAGPASRGQGRAWKGGQRAPGRPHRPRRGRRGVREPAGRRATQGRLVPRDPRPPRHGPSRRAVRQGRPGTRPQLGRVGPLGRPPPAGPVGVRRPPSARCPRRGRRRPIRARQPWSASGPAAWWPSPRRRPTRGYRGSRRSGRSPATSRTSPTGASASA